MQEPTPPDAPKPHWLRRLFDRGSLRGLGTTLGVCFAFPFGLILGLILGGTWAGQANEDWAETARWGGLALNLFVIVLGGGVIGMVVGGGLEALRLPDNGRSRALVGALTGALVCIGPMIVASYLLAEGATPEEKQTRLQQNLMTLTMGGALTGAVFGGLMGAVLRKPPRL